MAIVEVEFDLNDATSQVVEMAEQQLGEYCEGMAQEAIDTAVCDCDIETIVQETVGQEVADIDVSDTVETAVTDALTGVDWEGEIPAHLWDSMYGQVVEKILKQVLELSDRVYKLEQSKLRGR